MSKRLENIFQLAADTFAKKEGVFLSMQNMTSPDDAFVQIAFKDRASGDDLKQIMNIIEMYDIEDHQVEVYSNLEIAATVFCLFPK